MTQVNIIRPINIGSPTFDKERKDRKQVQQVQEKTFKKTFKKKRSRKTFKRIVQEKSFKKKRKTFKKNVRMFQTISARHKQDQTGPKQ